MSNPAERLVKFVMREYGKLLTPTQTRSAWQYMHARSGAIIGVIVPADEGHPEIRVMLHEADGKSGFTTDNPPPLELA